MTYRRKIDKQERWQRTWAIPFLQECLDDEWEITSGLITDHYDVRCINYRKKLVYLCEIKEWTKNPEDYQNLIIKQDKVKGLEWDAHMMYNDEVHDMKFIPLFLVFFTGNTTAYLYNLDHVDQCELVNMKQKVVNWSDRQEFKYFPTYLIPRSEFHTTDIKKWLDMYGYNKDALYQ